MDIGINWWTIHSLWWTILGSNFLHVVNSYVDLVYIGLIKPQFGFLSLVKHDADLGSIVNTLWLTLNIMDFVMYFKTSYIQKVENSVTVEASPIRPSHVKLMNLS